MIFLKYRFIRVSFVLLVLQLVLVYNGSRLKISLRGLMSWIHLLDIQNRDKVKQNRDSVNKNMQYMYESIASVGESRVWWGADFQSGSRV